MIGSSFLSSSTTRSIRCSFTWYLLSLIKKDPMFHLQINGEAIWKWREVYGHPSTLFDLLQRSILSLGYELMEPSRQRVGNVLAVKIKRFWQKIQATTNGKKRKRLKEESWVKLAISNINSLTGYLAYIKIEKLLKIVAKHLLMLTVQH